MINSIQDYEEEFKRIWQKDVSNELSDIFTYLFYEIKMYNKSDDFKKCKEVGELSTLFNDTNLGNYFRKELNELKPGSIYSIFALYETTDIDVLREKLKDGLRYCFRDYSRYNSKEEGKYDIEDLIFKMLELKKGQEVLYVYDDSNSMIEKMLDKDIKLTIFFDMAKKEDNQDRRRYEEYFWLKVFTEINEKNINIILSERILLEKKFDRIYCEYSNLYSRDITSLQVNIINNCLNTNGKAIKIVSDVVLDANDEDMKLERFKNLDSKMLKSIITFPSTIGARYFRRGTNKALILYDNLQEHDDIYMVDAQTICNVDKNSSWFSEDNIKNIVSYTNNEVEGISKKVSYKNIRDSKDLSFAPYEYVDRGMMLNNAIELSKIADVRRGNFDYIRSRNKLPNNDSENIDNYIYKKLSQNFLDDENYNALEKIETDVDFSNNLLEDGDILMNKNGNPIRIVLFKDDNNFKTLADGNIIIVHPNKEKVLPEYLKIYLDSEEGRKALENIAHSGTTIRSINVSRLVKIMVPLVDMNKQIEFVKKHNEILKNIENEMNNLKELSKKCFYKI